MKLFISTLLVYFISASVVLGNDDKSNGANVENLKILRKSVNFAFKLGNDFLDLIRGSTPPHELTGKILQLMEKKIVKLNDITPVFMPVIGYLVLIVIGFLFVVLMPIVGFCFCLCRCGGKCGGKVKGMDPKHAICKRYTYAVILGMISVVMLAGIVLAFINNQLIHDTLTNPSKEINAISQIQTSVDIMSTSFINISREINEAEKKSQTKDDKIDKVIFVNLLSEKYFKNLRTESLNSKIKDSLTTVMRELKASIEFLQKVKRPNENMQNLYKTLNEFIENLEVTKMQTKVKDLLSIYNSDFEELKKIMKNQAKPESTGEVLKRIVNNYKKSIVTYVNKGLTDYKNVVKLEYLEYRMYICIGVCCLLLLIVLFYFLGLCFGQCGERPFEDARICNRGVGANLMMAGVAFAFLFTPTIMFLTMSLFIFGGPSQTEYCRYLTNSYGDGVKTFDSYLKLLHKEINIIDTKNSNRNDAKEIVNGFEISLDSLINRCPTMSMALAFNVHQNLLSSNIETKIINISLKIKEASKDDLLKSYFENIVNTLDGIRKESQTQDKYSGFDPDTFSKISDQFKSILTEVDNFKPSSYELKFLNFFDSNIFNSTLTNEVKSILNEVYIGSFESVKCVGMHNATKMFIDALCVTFLWPCNGFWYGVGICLLFTIPAIIFAVKLAGLYRHTEKYSADYEEPDYHSYMGFYTNNADNIPMKKPKSGKASQKNRNSSFNNKDSLKQTNPQYLPVYPYDSYE